MIYYEIARLVADARAAGEYVKRVLVPSARRVEFLEDLSIESGISLDLMLEAAKKHVADGSAQILYEFSDVESPKLVGHDDA